jgi:micrococcal nuclease
VHRLAPSPVRSGGAARPTGATPATPSASVLPGFVALVALAALVGLAGLAAPGCSRPAVPATAPVPGGGTGLVAHVDHVTDGDTVTLRIAGAEPERARLLGIDTPETVKPDAPVECFGPEASARTKVLLPEGTEVLVQRDAEARDRYGRLLVYLWRRTDGLFVNRTLLAEGYASVLSIAPNTARRADLAAAERGARAAGTGLWGACGDPGGR